MFPLTQKLMIHLEATLEKVNQQWIGVNLFEYNRVV